MTSLFDYSHCLIREIPDSFLSCLKESIPSEPIDILKARTQHTFYQNLLKSVVPNVVQLPTDSDFPDSCFVEDTAVIAGGRAVITRSGAPERRGEESATWAALQNIGLTWMARIEAPGTLDGGDVLYTGHEFLVGLSKRTNLSGIRQLQEAFKDVFPVYQVPVIEGLHLKSLISLLEEDTLIYSGCHAGQYLRVKLENLLPNTRRIQYVQVPDRIAANVLRIRNTVLFQQGFPRSEEVVRNFFKSTPLQLVSLPMSELIKADGALTCCSILFHH